MKVLQRYRRLAGYIALALILSSAAALAAGPAQARVTVMPTVSHLMASWGDNSWGELGDGTTALLRTQYRDIAAGSRITQISAGGAHMLALRSDGTVLAWGLGVRGQLGNGVQTQASGPVQVTNLAGVTQVAAGTLSSYAVHTVLRLVGQSA